MKERTRKKLQNREVRLFWNRLLCFLSCVTVFCTTYALVLPAISMEKNVSCGMEEHQHDDSCYEEELVCGQEEKEAHHHTDQCYTVEERLVCGEKEHSHGEGCYDSEGNLTCTLAEHLHTDECYKESRILTCPLEETEGHTHSASCYEKVLVCEKEVHIHTDKCYKNSESTSEDDQTQQSTASVDSANPAYTGDQAAEAAGDASSNASGQTAEETVRKAVAGELVFEGPDFTVRASFGREAGIPAGAELEVREILPEPGAEDKGAAYEEYLEKTGEALEMETADFRYARFFDIKIVETVGETREKVTIVAPVDVKIDLAEQDPAEDADVSTRVVHFADEESTGEIVENVEVSPVLPKTEQGTELSFEAPGFSVYAIVDAPERYETQEETLVDLEDFYDVDDISQVGFYLSVRNPKKYFSSSLNKKNCLIEQEDWKEAAVWFFEPAEGQTHHYYMFAFVNGSKKYLKQLNSNDKKDVTLADSTDTAFELELSNVGNGTFYIKHAEQNLWLQHSNGGGGIRFYTDHNNGNNSQITMTYASSLTVPDDPYGLDGQTWGIVYDADSIFCTALMSDSGTSGSLAGRDMTSLETQGHSDHLVVLQDSDITEWTFHAVMEDYYYVTTNLDGQTKYLTIRNGFAGLSDEAGEDSLLRFLPGVGKNEGSFSLSAGSSSLAMTGTEGNRTFTGTDGDTSKKWLKFAEKSTLSEEDYLVYTANKISVSDPAEQIILYTRVWNGSKYEFYLVDYDGSLIRCYDEGDVIKWIGNQYETAVWKLTDYYKEQGQEGAGTPSGYYNLQNTYSGQYLAPLLSGNTILSDSLAKLNLDGRYYQEDCTKVKYWDNTYYSYSGLKVDLENNRVVPCPSAKADDFYFARVKEPKPHLTEVDTINNDDFGITMKMIDFNNKIQDNRDSGQTKYLGLNTNKAGLLTTDLKEDGYPDTTHNNKSLGELYAGCSDANHLFIQSVYDESGYFEYDSTKNFAWLDGSDFEVYDQLATIERHGTYPTSDHGQFMPYNSLINPETGEPWPYSKEHSNKTSVTAAPLSEDDPRYGEGLHEIPLSKADYFFGMEMSAAFTQTADGLDAWGHDIIFDFSGDDDFWLYVDNELVLDLGGVHQAMTGSVNFRTGIVTGRNGKTSTLRQIFESNYRARNKHASDAEVKEYLLRFFDEGETVFRDFTTHRMKIFYMERGAGASNLYMRFNLTAVKPGQVTLTKQVTGTEDIDFDLMEFPYQILYKTSQGDAGEWEQLVQDPDSPAVMHQGTKRPVKFADHFTPVGEAAPYTNVFFLKPGETASITMPLGTKEYKIVECGVNMNIFKSVKANGKLLSSETDAGRKDYETAPATLEELQKIEYENEVDPGSLRTLTITKNLWDENGYRIIHEGEESESREGTQLYGYEDDETTFAYRVFMSTQGSSELTPAWRKKYYVKDPAGNYCRWDPSLQQFVSLGIKEYPVLADYLAALSEEEQERIVFESSINGSVSGIPGGFSVEFRGLPVESSFHVIEREDEIPAGYSLIDYERDKGSYISEGEEENQGTIRANEDPHIIVHNKRGWGLTVNKIWSDADYMDSHDDIYFAVYRKNHPDGESGQEGDTPSEGSGQAAGGGTAQEYTLVNGTVRRLTAPAASLYYYFDELETGASFEDYEVFEVRLTDPAADEDGNITYSAIDRIGENGILTVGGKPKGSSHQDGFTYKVSYAKGQPHGGKEDVENIREDTVTNTRRGLRLIKTDWNGQVLPGAVFTLKDAEGSPIGAQTYTSDQNGLITIAYLDPGTYTLEETVSPSGFRKPSPWTITVKAGDQVTVAGDTGSWELTPGTAEDMAVVTLKNKGFSLQALKVEKKVDAGSGEVQTGDHLLKNAVFALYRQVTTFSGQVKDQHPMPGYDSLTTGADGVIPGISAALPVGTYYLTEVTAPTGYQQLVGDLVFTISGTGVVEIPEHVDSADPSSLIILNNLPDSGVGTWISSTQSDEHVTYTIRIPDEPAGVPVRIVKTDQEGHLLEAAGFTFAGEALPETVVCTSIKDTVTYGDKTLEEALIYENAALPLGSYTLTETLSPDGYIGLEAPVAITVESTGAGPIVTARINGEATSFARTERIDPAHPEYGWRVTIMNSTGYELPSTGGCGTYLLTSAGCLLLLGAVLALIRKLHGNLAL